jgi:hypothetical protein
VSPNEIWRMEGPSENMVADYVANRMSEVQAQEFELYCLNHPEFAQHVEREVALKTGMRQAQAAGSEDAKVSAVPSPKRRYLSWPLALAASIVIIISAVVVYQYSSKSPPGIVAFKSLNEVTNQLRHAAVSEIRLVRVRGADSVTRVSVPTEGLVDIRLLPDVPSKSGVYSIQIAAEPPLSISALVVRDLKPDANGYLQLYVAAAPLVGHSWLISVGEGGSVEAFRVEFTSASATAH